MNEKFLIKKIVNNSNLSVEELKRKLRKSEPSLTNDQIQDLIIKAYPLIKGKINRNKTEKNHCIDDDER